MKDASRCPLCGGSNGCAVANGRDPAGCWCMKKKIPAGLRERAGGRGACICRSCVESFEKGSAAGTKRPGEDR